MINKHLSELKKLTRNFDLNNYIKLVNYCENNFIEIKHFKNYKNFEKSIYSNCFNFTLKIVNNIEIKLAITLKNKRLILFFIEREDL